MNIPEFKYFKDFLKNATFTDKQCDICSSNEYCLEAEYFESDEEYSSVCLKCLINGNARVTIPQHLIKRLRENIKLVNIDIQDDDLKEKINNYILELSKTPPVAWIQFNNWPVYNGDFMRFIGEWTKEDIILNAPNNDGKAYLKLIVDDLTKNKIDDFDIFWEDIEKYTAIFVFESLDSKKRIAIAQNY